MRKQRCGTCLYLAPNEVRSGGICYGIPPEAWVSSTSGTRTMGYADLVTMVHPKDKACPNWRRNPGILGRICDAIAKAKDQVLGDAEQKGGGR